jgi:hypothetical protein
MLNEHLLIARVRLPPDHPAFPQPALLHAICASASAYTGWVNSLPPLTLPHALHQQSRAGLEGENVSDFGLAQAEASQRAVRTADQTCLFAPSEATFEVLQASVSTSRFSGMLITVDSSRLLLHQWFCLAEPCSVSDSWPSL